MEGKKILQQHKELIAKELVSSGKTNDVIFELRENGILHPAAANSLLGEETTKTNKMRKLINHLETRNEEDFNKFVQVLVQLDLMELVKKMGTKVYNKHRDSISGDSDELDKLQRVPHSPLSPPPGAEALPFFRRHKPQNQHSRPSSNGYDSGDDIISPDDPLRIDVRPSIQVGGGHLEEGELYRNLSSPRGLVFIANYKDFYNDEHPKRTGSEIDVKNLSLLFTQMGYKIPKQHINMSKYETIKALREFKSREELHKVDSCIVIVMSHGRDEKSFFTSDNQYLSVNDVVERFSNRECPALKGKPKIFIFQYCRGSAADVGVMPVPKLVKHDKGSYVETDASYQSEAIIERDPTYTDMYIAYSSVEGFVSFRHPERGSWLMEAICCVFMKHASHLELESLMKMVSRRVRQNYTDDGSKQVCEFVQRAFDRHFYFNPKLPDNMLLNN